MNNRDKAIRAWERKDSNQWEFARYSFLWWLVDENDPEEIATRIGRTAGTVRRNANVYAFYKTLLLFWKQERRAGRIWPHPRVLRRAANIELTHFMRAMEGMGAYNMTYIEVLTALQTSMDSVENVEVMRDHIDAIYGSVDVGARTLSRFRPAFLELASKQQWIGREDVIKWIQEGRRLFKL